jgi:hypothetical protein
MLLLGLYKLLTAAPANPFSSLLAQPAASSIFMNVAVEQAGRPYLVLNNVSAPPAGETLDGISDLIDGEIQLDSYADDQPTATKVSRALRDYLMKTFVAGTLPDGTTIQFVSVTTDQDEPYELGGAGYIHRRLLRLQAFYTEGAD